MAQTFVRKLWLSPGYNRPRVDCMVEMEIEFDALIAMLGEKALRNKSKRTRALSRMVTVTVRETVVSREAREGYPAGTLHTEHPAVKAARRTK